MSTPPRTIWLVGSPSFVDRAMASGWSDAGLARLGMPWSERHDAEDADAGARALAAGGFDLVMLTSAHAVTALPDGIGVGHEAACVGVATAEAARSRGFTIAEDVKIAGVVRGGRALGEAIAARTPRPARVLWLCGEDRRPEARDALVAAGIELDEVVTYVMAPRDDFPAMIEQAPEPAAVVLGSPRGVDALAAALLLAHRALAEDAPVVVPEGAVTEARARDAFGGRVHVAAPRADRTGTDYAGAVVTALGGAASDD